MRKVTSESGVNIGSVRYYFGSYEELMVAAAQEKHIAALIPDSSLYTGS